MRQSINMERLRTATSPARHLCAFLSVLLLVNTYTARAEQNVHFRVNVRLHEQVGAGESALVEQTHAGESALVEQTHAGESALVEQTHARESALVEQPLQQRSELVENGDKEEDSEVIEDSDIVEDREILGESEQVAAIPVGDSDLVESPQNGARTTNGQQRSSGQHESTAASGQSGPTAPPTLAPPTLAAGGAGCDLCASMALSKEQLDYVHVERAKQRILSKLRLREAPNITQPLPALPHSLLKQGGTLPQDADQSSEAFYAETQQMVILAEDVSVCDDDSKSVCFSLSIRRQINLDEVRSLKFHAYRNSGQHLSDPEIDTLQLFDRTTSGDVFLTKEVVERDRHWLPFKIPRRLVSILQTNPTNASRIDDDSSAVTVKRLKLKCSACSGVQAFTESSLHRAYLEIKTAEARWRSRRSAVECQPGLDQCCKVRLYVSFRSMGWDDWILSPDGYWANYCAGSCRDRHELPAHQHSRIMMGLSHEQQRSAHNHYHPCCSPTSLSQLSLLYMDSDGQLIKKNLPNMSVQTCGCA